MPDSEAAREWIRRSDAARAEDRRRDEERSMSARLEEAVRLSRLASEFEENLDPDLGVSSQDGAGSNGTDSVLRHAQQRHA